MDNTDCAEISRARLPLADVTVTQGQRTVMLIAEIASEREQQIQGLMCRETVPAGTGMLFVYDEEREGGFWMFNTYAPLDIIYFGAASGAVSLRQMQPCPRIDAEVDEDWRNRCSVAASGYRSDTAYTTTLELPLGWLESQGFDTADPSGIVVSFSARG